MNTIKLKFYQPVIISTLAVFFVSGIFTTGMPSADVSKIAEKRSSIYQKIDSLDLLKQNLKRSGSAIGEIEQQQEMLRDSLRMLRNHINSTEHAAPAPRTKKKNSPFLQKPTNLFDWIIVIVGIVATFSGLMLIIGISRTLNIRRKRKTHKKEHSTRNYTQPEPPDNEKPSAAYPDYNVKPASSSPVTETNLSFQIRQRLEEQESVEQFDAPEIPEPPPVPQKLPSIDSTENGTIEDQVITAARSGSDVSAISRKFHLSSDHVALILKMAENKSKAR